MIINIITIFSYKMDVVCSPLTGRFLDESPSSADTNHLRTPSFQGSWMEYLKSSVC